ncbi:MAG: helix-turn-helix transcriptional regulator, partial [Clostridiales bacterium]|nr:helix-turn-helix transcriptional regulator [Clostridiales bacterium]
MDQNEEVNSINSDLIRGHIDTIILKALQAGDRYGYDIIKEIEQKSDGQYVIKQPTLYSCLKRLEVQGFVKSYWGSKSIGGRKKYFTLTDMGRELFIKNKSDWDYSRNIINKLISDEDYSIGYEYSEQSEAIENAVTEVTEAETAETEVTDTKAHESEETQFRQLSIDDFEETESEPIEESELAENEESFEQVGIEEFDEEESTDNNIEAAEESDDEFEDVDALNGQADIIVADDEEQDDIIVGDEQQPEANEYESANDNDEFEESADNTSEDIAFLEDEFNEISFVDNDGDSNESSDTDEFGEIIVGDSYQEDLPLSAAEQSHANEEGLFEEDNADLINRFYDEQSQESYLSNVGNTQYDPSSDEEIDYNNYFADIDDEYEDEDEVASAVIAEEDALYYDDAIILPPDEPIEESIQEEAQPACDAVILPPDEPIEEPIQEEAQPACDAVILPPDEPIEEP